MSSVRSRKLQIELYHRELRAFRERQRNLKRLAFLKREAANPLADGPTPAVMGSAGGAAEYLQHIGWDPKPQPKTAAPTLSEIEGAATQFLQQLGGKP